MIFLVDDFIFLSLLVIIDLGDDFFPLPDFGSSGEFFPFSARASSAVLFLNASKVYLLNCILTRSTGHTKNIKKSTDLFLEAFQAETVMAVDENFRRVIG